MMHSHSIEPGIVRRFGMIGSGLFSVLTGVAIWRDRPVMIAIFVVLFGLCLACSLAPRPMTPVYRTWVRVATLIGRTISLVVLTVFYFLVITPVALAGRRWFRRGMAQKPDPNADSYWVQRSTPVQEHERFVKRY